jgi:hypothetical protein
MARKVKKLQTTLSEYWELYRQESMPWTSDITDQLDDLQVEIRLLQDERSKPNPVGGTGSVEGV